MKYVIVETSSNASRVIGATSDMVTAKNVMTAGFQKIFAKKFQDETESARDFEQVYKKHLGDPEFGLHEKDAYINNVNDRSCNYNWKILETVCENISEKPLSILEMLDCCDLDFYVEGNVLVRLSELVDNNDAWKIIAKRLAGSPSLRDIHYSLADVLDENLMILYVRGNIEGILELEMDDLTRHTIARKLVPYLQNKVLMPYPNGMTLAEGLTLHTTKALTKTYVWERLRAEEK